jgi:dienelactone hydrolase
VGTPTISRALIVPTLSTTHIQSVEFVLYPGAPHAFFSDDRPQVYKKDAAEDAWKRCVAFFDKYLKG